MILIPQKLFQDAHVEIIFRHGISGVVIKTLRQTLTERQAYLSSHVIAMVLEGEQHIRPHKGDLIKVSAGQTLMLPRGIYYISDLVADGGAFKSLLFYFEDTLLHEFLQNGAEFKKNEAVSPDSLIFPTDERILYFAETFLKLYRNTKVQNSDLLSLKTKELLHLLSASDHHTAIHKFFLRMILPEKRNIKGFMEHHFDKPLKIKDYAYLVGRSASAFRRDFKAGFDMTPQQWLRKKRLEKAIHLIEENTWSVTQLAYEAGYENISHFIKEFRKEVGYTPKQYMLMMEENAIKI